MQTGLAVVDLVGTIVVLLLIAGGVRAVTKRVKVPYTVVLVLVGIALKQLGVYGPAFLGPFAEFEISPDVILFVFLPTIIFESAFNLDARQLRQNLLPVLVLAVPGLALSTPSKSVWPSGFSSMPSPRSSKARPAPAPSRPAFAIR